MATNTKKSKTKSTATDLKTQRPGASGYESYLKSKTIQAAENPRRRRAVLHGTFVDGAMGDVGNSVAAKQPKHERRFKQAEQAVRFVAKAWRKRTYAKRGFCRIQ